MLPGESRYQYRQLRKTMWLEYKPMDDLESILVDHLVFSYWRLRRALKLETKLMNEVEAEWNKYTTQNENITPLNFINFDSLEQFTRYLTSIERAIFRAQNELTKIKALRNKKIS